MSEVIAHKKIQQNKFIGAAIFFCLRMDDTFGDHQVGCEKNGDRIQRIQRDYSSRQPKLPL